jgi:peptidyl-prolyl cis-trans isomerase SurA
MKQSAVAVLLALFVTPELFAQGGQLGQASQTSPKQSDDNVVVEEIVARVNNSIITRADLRRSREQLQSDVRQQDPANADTLFKNREKDLLRDLIDQQLLIEKAKDLDINADTDVIKRLDDLRKQMHADSMEDLEKAAQAQGISFDDFKQNLKNQILSQKVISQEVGSHISVTSAEVQQFYDQHKAEMERPEQVRLSEILIPTSSKPPVKTEKGEAALPETPSPEQVAAAKEKADQMEALLKKGLKFEDLAKQYSSGPTSAVGGDLEYFKRGVLAKELEDKVFNLKAGEYTEPIRTKEGFVILKVTEHQAAGIPPLKEVEPQIQEQLYLQRMQPSLREYLTKLREEAYIDIKAGYVDTGASPNETKPIYTTASVEGAKKLKKKKRFGVF